MNTSSIWFEPELRAEYHIKIHKCNGAWNFHCPEHMGRGVDGAGPYPAWETAMDLADLHLRTHNHF